MPPDLFNLGRFITAQESTYAIALHELQAGRKRSHWMWFIFPQIAGLGFSPRARHYAIRSLDEAHAFLAHPLLGPRLRECTRAVNGIERRSLEEIFEYPDHLKFRSSMTLFELVAGAESEFSIALDTHCSGQRDDATLARVAATGCST